MTSKWERREAKRRSERRRIPKHGGTLATIYANAVTKRARNQKRRKR
jgi:ribosomal protein L25 (general stress protein Ctc)